MEINMSTNSVCDFRKFLPQDEIKNWEINSPCSSQITSFGNLSLCSNHTSIKDAPRYSRDVEKRIVENILQGLIEGAKNINR
jgi:hypothetical protein